ncbi:MAG: arginyltransferase [Paracoccus sp. (in: a-proteobacteria)]
MTIERRNFPQFFVTAPTPCPYLPGRVERKVFTHLVGHDAGLLNSQLSQGGFRRSQNIVYRPACEFCTACVSVRVPVASFHPGRSFRRVLKTNSDIVSSVVPARATSEHYSLFRAYIDARHSDGGMAEMSALDFAAMVNDSLIDNRLIEYRLKGADGAPGDLVAVVLIDILSDGLSMIYSFYEPEMPHRSFGSYMILDNIFRAQKLGVPYLYLGYWVEGSRKMDYKARFLPQERLTSDGWVLCRG